MQCPHCDKQVTPVHFYRSGKARCMNRRTWTTARRFRLMGMIDAGKSDADIAVALGVSKEAVKLTRRRYQIAPVYAHALSARHVADMMGIGCAKTVSRWIEGGYLAGHRGYMQGVSRVWIVQRIDLWDFIAAERTWHLWHVERITEPDLRRHAETVRGSVRFLTPSEAGHRLYIEHGTVNAWIHRGWLPARRWGNWWIDERDIARVAQERSAA